MGMYASPDSWWTNGHRVRLVTLANVLEGKRIARPPTREWGRDEFSQGTRGRTPSDVMSKAAPGTR